MRSKRKGQSLVEFALILPVLLLVFFSIIDGALVVQGLLTVNFLARQAARFATTYQPANGECYEHFENGIEDNSYPWCPSGGHNESDAAYYERRADIIKNYARDNATGLRITKDCTNELDVDSCLTNDTPGLFGTRVLGFMTFEASELANAQMANDQPGLPGLPVQVQVVHHVPLVFFSAILGDQYVRIEGSSEMINEGVQAGIGAEPPPVGAPANPPGPPEDPPPPVESPSPAPSTSPSAPPSVPPDSVTIELNFETALNVLPDERAHFVIATVQQAGQPVAAGWPVEFTTDAGSFDYSGSEIFQTKTVNTNINGEAKVTIYANEPMVANIMAWMDANSDGVKQTLEVDTAVKTWQVTGPYLVASDHYPAPEDVIGVALHDHEPLQNPYTLWWCTSNENPATVPLEVQLANNVFVDTVTWFFEVTNVAVPTEAAGTYYVESHSGAGGCGAADWVARSSTILIKEVPPDLTITDLKIVAPLPTELGPDLPMTVAVTIQNLQPIAVTTGPFDVDIYPHLDDAPYVMQLSESKEWVAVLGPGATQVLTFTVTSLAPGGHTLWAQVDTTNYIAEANENNNVLSLEYEVLCYGPGSDNFDDGLKGFWTEATIGNASGAYAINGNGELEMNYKASSGLWGYKNHNFAYIYQSYPGDFDARVRILEHPDRRSYAKMGLHIRESANAKAHFIHSMAMNNGGTKAQIGYDSTYIAQAFSIAVPYWARIVRTGNLYEVYTSQAVDPVAGDWTFRGQQTLPARANDDYELPLIGIAHASYYNSENSRNLGRVDDFRICSPEDGAESSSAPPPGLEQCEELLNVRSFEGNRDTVFSYWRAGDAGAYRQTSEQRYLGNFSIRMHASYGSYPCDQNNYDPYLYQDIIIPTGLYSISTLLVEGHYLVKPATGDILQCSTGASDPLDKLSLELQALDADGNSTVIGTAQEVLNGGAVTDTWHTIEITASASFNLKDYEAQTLRLYWDAFHNEDFDGTLFYVDDVSAQVCTVWPIPVDEPGTVSFGGLLSTNATGSSIRVPLPGADVWAYTQSGETHHTTSIHDGTYHFYNLPQAGTYVVYAESLVAGELRTAVANVPLNLNERNYNVNLFLQ